MAKMTKALPIHPVIVALFAFLLGTFFLSFAWEYGVQGFIQNSTMYFSLCRHGNCYEQLISGNRALVFYISATNLLTFLSFGFLFILGGIRQLIPPKTIAKKSPYARILLILAYIMIFSFLINILNFFVLHLY